MDSEWAKCETCGDEDFMVDGRNQCLECMATLIKQHAIRWQGIEDAAQSVVDYYLEHGTKDPEAAKLMTNLQANLSIIIP